MKRSLFDRLKKNMQDEGWSPRHVVASVVFGAIVIVFIFFGMSGKHNALGGGSGAAAQVNASLISAAELSQETQRLEQMYAPMFGGQIQSEAQRQFLKQQALESLISNELMVQGASKLGILSTDKEVLNVITTEIPVFQNNGKFQRDRYLGILEANRLTAGEFEEKIRKERKGQRLRRVFEVASSPTAQELVKAKELREKQRNVMFVKFEKPVAQSKMNVTDAEADKRLADAEFNQKVKAEFEANKAQYGSEEQVKAQHILVRFTAGDAAAEKMALDKIQSLQKRAQKEDFGKLAAEFSDDTGSKVNKGDLGYFGKGKMVPEFDKAAFSQKEGVVGEPVKTEFGFHLIKVNDHKQAVEAKIETASRAIAKKLIAADKFDVEMKSIEEAIAKADYAKVESSVKSLGLSWQETGFFELGTDSAPGLSSAVATTEALLVSEKEPFAKKIIRDGGAQFLIKWKADKQTPIPAGEKISDTIAKERSYDLMNSWLEALRKEAHIERNIQPAAGL